MSDNLLTVAICAYNAQDTIRDTLRSLSLQTCTQFNIIVIEDGENTEQHEIIGEELCNMPGGVFATGQILTENVGIGAARNVALSLTRTPYISFLDADDLLMPHAVETLTEACRADCEAVIGKTMREAPDGRFEIVGIEERTWLHGRAYKMEMLGRYGILFPKIRMSEDLGFNACVEEFADRNRIAQTYTPIHVQKWRLGSLSRSYDSGWLSSQTYIDALAHYIKSIQDNGVTFQDAKVLPGFMAGAYYRVIMNKDPERRRMMGAKLRAALGEELACLHHTDTNFGWKLAKELAKGFIPYSTTTEPMLRLWDEGVRQ